MCDSKENYVSTFYRITKEQDIAVKKNAKKFGGESAYIRELITREVILK